MLNAQGSLNKGVLAWPAHASIWEDCECDSDQAIYSVYKLGDHNEKYETPFGDMMWGGSLEVPDLPNEIEALLTLHHQAANTVDYASHFSDVNGHWAPYS